MFAAADSWRLVGMQCAMTGRTVLALLVLAVTVAAHLNTFKVDFRALKNHFRCPPCDKSLCAPLFCKEKIKASGLCACCFTCALTEGDRCGFFTAKCGRGLRCYTNNADIMSAFSGKGVCVQEQKDLHGSKYDQSSSMGLGGSYSGGSYGGGNYGSGNYGSRIKRLAKRQEYVPKV